MIIILKNYSRISDKLCLSSSLTSSLQIFVSESNYPTSILIYIGKSVTRFPRLSA